MRRINEKFPQKKSPTLFLRLNFLNSFSFIVQWRRLKFIWKEMVLSLKNPVYFWNFVNKATCPVKFLEIKGKIAVMERQQGCTNKGLNWVFFFVCGWFKWRQTEIQKDKRQEITPGKKAQLHKRKHWCQCKQCTKYVLQMVYGLLLLELPLVRQPAVDTQRGKTVASFIFPAYLSTNLNTQSICIQWCAVGILK